MNDPGAGSEDFSPGFLPNLYIGKLELLEDYDSLQHCFQFIQKCLLSERIDFEEHSLGTA